jgi:predicted CopG family antitoxin
MHNCSVPVFVMSKGEAVKLRTIRVSVEACERLKAMGKKGETYDDVLRHLLDRVERRKRKKTLS